MTNDEYWSIDIPGLTEAQAEGVRQKILADVDRGVVLLPPDVFMVRGFDVPAAKILAISLRLSLTQGVLSAADESGARGMLEDFEEWLGRDRPGPLDAQDNS